jgi:hypothetical protein
MKKILAYFKKDYITHWRRNTQEANKEIRYIAGLCFHYAHYFNSTPGDVLRAMEKGRDYSWPNYYHRKFSRIDKMDKIFENEDEAKAFFKDKIFICPACHKESTDPYECSSNGCNWKSYGFMGCLGHEYQFIIKDTFLENPKIHRMFQPQTRT